MAENQSQNHSFGKEIVSKTIVKIWVMSPVDKAFDYRIDESPVEIGSVVEVPFGTRSLTGVVWSVSDQNDQEKIKPISALKDLPPLKANMREFIERMSEYTLTPIGKILPMILRTPPPLANPPKWIEAQMEFNGKLSPKQQALYDELKTHGATDPKSLNYSKTIIKALIEKTAAFWVEPQRPAMPVIKPILERLSPAQSRALDEAKNTNLPILLKGVTGSGKTEIYLELIAEALGKGEQVLLLLPEIALTAGFIKRCYDRFGIKIGHWHSEMNVSARRDIWHGVAKGEMPIVIGARSALFLPFQKLGLIVVDEEHDRGYKQEEGVIYNGRDMAVLRAYVEGAKIVLASATPSIESMANAKAGKYRLVELHERFGKATLPGILRIDMRQAGLDASHWISPQLINAISQRIRDNEQSLLFLNRRGFAPLTICRACGHQIGCPHCDARMVEHRVRNRLVCHQCGHESALPDICPECEVEGKLFPIGPGVERLAEEVREKLPEARICVLSSDITQGEAALKREFEAITNNQYDVIIGTQMIAKGHNFPELTLVGIVDADVGLDGGDFRAAEHSFQLLRQVTGRAGRSDKPGIAMVQSYQPEHPILMNILNDDDRAFYEGEITRRQNAIVPPFSRYIAVIISAPDFDMAMNAGRDLLQKSTPLRQHSIQIFGPAIAPISRIRGRARVRMLLKMPKNLAANEAVRIWQKSVKLPAKVKIALDVDPLSFF